MSIVVHTDGGARGNPGPAAIGAVIEMSNVECRMSNIEISKRIGEATNNVAEYRAVIEAFKIMLNAECRMPNRTGERVEFYLDSLLVVNQLNGVFKVKDAALRQLLLEIKILEQEVGGVVTYSHIPREQNKRADFLVNEALDDTG